MSGGGNDLLENIRVRYAPSPTGEPHLGNIRTALFNWLFARHHGGSFIVRFEDTDRARYIPEALPNILETLRWLGLDWDGQPRRQSDNMGDYKRALDKLSALDLLYPCYCTRKEILAEISNADAAPHSVDGLVYPGTCKVMIREEREARMANGLPYALRLDMEKASALTGPVVWADREEGEQTLSFAAGDIVIARKDIPTSYHLAVTLDDHRQRITLVTRGKDLFHATHIHRLLQNLLGLNTPEWHHHKLITNEEGSRLSKRGRALTVRALKRAGESPDSVRAMVGLS